MTRRRRPARLVVGLLAVTVLGACGAPGGPAAPAGTTAPAGVAAPTAGSGGTPASVTAAPEPVVPVDLEVAGEQVLGAPARVEVPLGATVRVTARTDRADELHLHGYDRTLPLAPGVPGVLEVVADLPGVFELELHRTRAVLPRLEVR